MKKVDVLNQEEKLTYNGGSTQIPGKIIVDPVFVNPPIWRSYPRPIVKVP